jgi:hypothetical protein
MACRSSKSRGQSVSIITVAGEEYTFISPNADTVSTLVKDFLAGLRRRSRWGIGLEDFHIKATGTAQQHRVTETEPQVVTETEPHVVTETEPQVVTET